MNTNFKKTIKELNNISKLLREAYIFDDEEEGMPSNDRMQMQQQDPRQMENEEGEPMMDEQTDGIIDDIRKLALDGIQKYAEDVDNEMYITFKKIWMMCDKCLSEKDKVEN